MKKNVKENLSQAKSNLEYVKEHVSDPFPSEEALKVVSARLDELNVMLSAGDKPA